VLRRPSRTWRWESLSAGSSGPARPYTPTLVAGPGGLWAAFGTSGGCDAALRTATGWQAVGLTNSVYSDFFWCQPGAFAAGPTFGPVVMFRNSNPAASNDAGVYAVNR
jgi:hypothetical protein